MKRPLSRLAIKQLKNYSLRRSPLDSSVLMAGCPVGQGIRPWTSWTSLLTPRKTRWRDTNWGGWLPIKHSKWIPANENDALLSVLHHSSETNAFNLWTFSCLNQGKLTIYDNLKILGSCVGPCFLVSPTFGCRVNHCGRHHWESLMVIPISCKGYRIDLDTRYGKDTLQETNISHLWKRKIIFKSALGVDMWVPSRVCLKMKCSKRTKCIIKRHQHHKHHLSYKARGYKSWTRSKRCGFHRAKAAWMQWKLLDVFLGRENLRLKIKGFFGESHFLRHQIT